MTNFQHSNPAIRTMSVNPMEQMIQNAMKEAIREVVKEEIRAALAPIMLALVPNTVIHEAVTETS